MSVCLFLAPLSFSCIHPIWCAVSTQAQTQSATNDCFIDEARVYSLTQARNNYRPNQLERGEKKTKKSKEPVGEDLSYIYSELNHTLGYMMLYLTEVQVLCSHGSTKLIYFCSVDQEDLFDNKSSVWWNSCKIEKFLQNCFFFILSHARIKAPPTLSDCQLFSHLRP